MSSTEGYHSALESRVAAEYKAKGFEVLAEPKREELPFDLGTYQPDLIAKKGPNEGYIIEVKGSISRTPIERYREIAEIVSQHPGWSFVLITGDDVPLRDSEADRNDLLTWEQMAKLESEANRLESLGFDQATFILLWGVFEAALRRHAIEASIPVERLPTVSLINHLYSQGELSVQQFDTAKALQAIRNRVVHGYQTPSLNAPTKQLQELVDELLQLWASKSTHST